ncbi:MAG: efflux RND transporter periplasmic adaptor subunit [Planctomycetota bacterium]|jgi:multidrug efflux pump subunit AcrA (membrane-fusion protein)
MNVAKQILKGFLLLAGALTPAVVLNLVESNLMPGRRSGPGSTSFYVVKRGPMAIRLKMEGMVKPKNAVKISPDIERSVKIIYKVPGGSRVKRGDVLVRLEIPRIEEDILQAERNIAEGIHAVEDLVAEYEIVKDEKKVNVDKTRIDYQVAVNDKKKYDEYEAPLAHKRVHVSIEEAEIRFARAKKKVERLKAYREKGFATRDEYIDGDLEVKKSRQALEKAKADLDLYLRFTRPMAMAQSVNRVKSAASALEAAKRTRDVKLRGLDLELYQRKKALLESRKRYAKLLEYQKRTVLKSPVDGVAIHGEIVEEYGEVYYWSSGDDTWGEDTIISIPASREVFVGIQVPEERIYLIEKGMKAWVAMDSAGLAGIEGEVSKVAELPSGGDWRMGDKIKVFSVEISIDPGGRFMRPNSNVQVVIEVAQLKEVLFVPAHAVKKEKGKDVCWVLRGTELVRTEVEVGASGEEYKEITAGLAEGDRVFLGLPEVYQPGAEEKAARAGGTEAGWNEGQ